MLPLQLEVGRFANIKLEDRMCQICKSGTVEDELHFLFGCVYKTQYDKLQVKVPELRTMTDVDKLARLCDMPHTFGNYLAELWKVRTEYINQN